MPNLRFIGLLSQFDQAIDLIGNLSDKVAEAREVATEPGDLEQLQDRLDRLHKASEAIGADLDAALEDAKKK